MVGIFGVTGAASDLSDDGRVMSWYYCLVHPRVEPEVGCPNAERLGPYDSEAEAANALQTAQERNEAFDADED